MRLTLFVHPDRLTVELVEVSDRCGWTLRIDEYCPRNKVYLLNPAHIVRFP